MFKMLLSILLITASFYITACSSDEEKEMSLSSEESTKEHLLSVQKHVLDSAKGVEQVLKDNANRRTKEIEEQTR